MTRRKTKVPTVGFVSLGCPKAASDAEQILTRLRAEGYEISGSYDGADLVVVNTCGFIDAAVEESLDAIGEALAENGKVIVTGCLGAKKDAAGNDIVRAVHPKVLAVTGPHATAGSDGRPCTSICLPLHDPFVDLVPPQGIRLTPDHYAYLKISEGCNHRCTFCIIPSLRGDLVSRPIGEVLREAEVLAEAGVKELLVISQDTSAYGVDVKYRTGFCGGRPVKTRLYELCSELGKLGLWVRLHYVYPYPSVDDLIPLMAEGKILPYLDVPFQHASPRILKLMKRPASAEKVLDRIAAWRREVPGSDDPQHLHHRLSRRDRGRVQRTAGFPRRGPARPRRRLRLFAGGRRQRPTRCPAPCRRTCAKSARRACCGIRKTSPPSGWNERSAAASRCWSTRSTRRAPSPARQGDAPDIDGLVYITDGHDLEVGEFAEVTRHRLRRARPLRHACRPLSERDCHLADLRAIVGERDVLTAAGDVAPYRTDWRGRYTGSALCVVLPGSTRRGGRRGARLRRSWRAPSCRRAATPGLCGGATPHRRRGGGQPAAPEPHPRHRCRQQLDHRRGRLHAACGAGGRAGGGSPVSAVAGGRRQRHHEVAADGGAAFGRQRKREEPVGAGGGLPAPPAACSRPRR